MNRNEYFWKAQKIFCPDTKETVIGYSNYLKSKHWLRMKRRVHKFYDNECQMCHQKIEGRDRKVHHLSYDRIGNELPGDVTLLCSKCHDQVHGYTETKKKSLKNIQKWMDKLTRDEQRDVLARLKRKYE